MFLMTELVTAKNFLRSKQKKNNQGKINTHKQENKENKANSEENTH